MISLFYFKGETCFRTKALATTCLLFGLKTLEFIGLVLFGKRVVGIFENEFVSVLRPDLEYETFRSV